MKLPLGKPGIANPGTAGGISALNGSLGFVFVSWSGVLGFLGGSLECHWWMGLCRRSMGWEIFVGTMALLVLLGW